MSVSGEMRGRKRQLLLPMSQTCLLASQIFSERGCHFGGFPHLVRNPVKELPYSWMLTVSDLIFCSDSEECAVVQHGDTIGDAEGTRQFMSHDDHGHLERLLKKENQFVQFCRNNRIEPSGRLVEYENLRIESNSTGHRGPFFHAPG